MNDSTRDPIPSQTAALSADSPLRALFEAAQAMPLAIRNRWLDELGLVAAKRAHVQALLAAADDTGSYPGQPVQEWFLSEHEDDWEDPSGLIGQSIGGFAIERLLGQGGMAVVYQAHRQHADFDQRVAVKLLRGGLYSQLEQKLFKRERQVLASLNHPNIARMIDGGVTDHGQPYLVMEFIDGQNLLDYARERTLGWSDCLRLLIDTARAVDAAHQQLIVHRDLKPSNVLVDQQGQVKLLDFGIAKLLDQEDAQTRTGIGMMTPAYAAPEQLAHQPVTTATDVYGLGLLLYELLLGSRPDRNRWGTRPSEHVRQTLTTETDARARQTTRRLSQFLKGDLDNILLKALDPEPSRRYRNAGQFADDLANFLAGRPVAAHPPSNWYRAGKFVQRHRGAVMVTALLIVAVLVSLALALVQSQEAQRQAARARAEAESARHQAARADAVKAFMLRIFSAAEARLPETERPTLNDLVNTANDALPDATDLDPISRTDILQALAAIAELIDADERALANLREAIALLQNLPEASRKRIELQSELASLLIRNERLTEAEALLTPLSNLPEADDAAGIALRRARSGLAENQGDFATAIGYSERNWQVQNGVDKVLAGTILSGQYARDGRLPEAAALMKQVLALLSAERGGQGEAPHDVQYARALAGLGVVELHQGQMQDGIAHLGQAIDLRRQIVQGNSRETADMLRSRAAALEATSQYDAAMADARSALAQFQALYGNEHRLSLSAALQIASLIHYQRGPAAAVPEYQKLIRQCQQLDLLEREPNCGLLYGNLANALSHIGRLSEALAAANESVRLRAALFGPEHPTYLMALAGKAGVLYSLNRHAEALQLLDAGIAVLAKQNLTSTPNYARMLRNRIDNLLRLGRAAEALTDLNQLRPLLDKFGQGNRRQQFEWQAFKALALAQSGDRAGAREPAELALAMQVPPETLTADRWQILRRLVSANGPIPQTVSPGSD